MPTRRSSTRSTRPTPCRAPIALRRATSSTGASASPFTDTGVPRAKPIVTSSGASGAAVGERVGPEGVRDLHLPPGDERARHGGAEEVLPRVHGTGAQRRPDELGDELLAQVFDVALL